ncbi:hypothetical protein [Gordonia sp. (in: high G+C Gram-positive bacteria)]|uniref:hypothetical protein n=1 Tax=Gordonia sp. (in: high G+C Gram-positive bacteria) TaxID=84139 RepID=UPI0039E4161E
MSLLGATRNAATSAVSAAVAVPRSVVHAVLDDVVDYLSGTDLTPVLTSAIDLNRVLATVDVQALVDRVDINRVLASVDLDALLARIDVNALLDRVDVDALVAHTDLTTIVRDASASVSSEVIDDVRSGSERADDGVERFVNRVLRRGDR